MKAFLVEVIGWARPHIPRPILSAAEFSDRQEACRVADYTFRKSGGMAREVRVVDSTGETVFARLIK